MKLNSRPPLKVRFDSPKHKTGTKLKRPPLRHHGSSVIRQSLQKMSEHGAQRGHGISEVLTAHYGVLISWGKNYLRWDLVVRAASTAIFKLSNKTKSLQPLSEGEKVCIGIFFLQI